MTVGNAVYSVVFSGVWFGMIVGFTIVGQLLPHAAREDWSTTARVAGTLGLLVLASLPALVYSVRPYKITLTEDGVFEFTSLLLRRRVRAQQVRAIEWDDEGEITIRHDRGRVKLIADRGFRDPLKRLLEENPGIKADDGVRRALGVVDD